MVRADMTTPLPSLRLPAEYEPQAAVWLSWPGNVRTWLDMRPAMERAYASFAAAISQRQTLHILCRHEGEDSARALLADSDANLRNVRWHDIPTNDAWCRDHGPLFALSPQGKVIVDFAYNAWGGKFPPWDLDDGVPARVSELRKLPRIRVPIIGEGGAIEVNRRAEMITTESVWLNDNRNPGLTRAAAEKIFADYLGVRETLWLPEGLLGDDTDGHIDTIARFADDDTVVAVLPDTDDPNHAVCARNRDLLAEKYNVVPLPHPHPIRPEGWREDVLPATYANFLILNSAVLVPTYRQRERDRRAMDVLRDVFSGREILGIDCGDIIWEGGALHCLSMQEAAG